MSSAKNENLIIAKTLGSTALLKAIFNKFELSKMVNELCPSEHKISNGDILELLIMNRLQSPKPLYKLDQWAEDNAVEDIYNIRASEFNDDRVGRFLDDLHPKLKTIQGKSTLLLKKFYKVAVEKKHADFSTFSVYGKYDEKNDDPYINITYGKSKQHRPDLKQYGFGITVSRDGAIPLETRIFDGNFSEIKNHIDNLRQLKEMFGEEKCLYIADSKFSSDKNMFEAIDLGFEFVCTTSFSKEKKEYVVKENVFSKMKELDYLTEDNRLKKIQGKPNEYYLGYETEKILKRETENGQEQKKIREIYIYSTEKAKQEKATKERHLKKIIVELEKLKRTAGKYNYKTKKDVEKKAAQIFSKKKSHYMKFFDYTISNNGTAPAFDFKILEGEIEFDNRTDGFYSLYTNMLPTEDLNSVLTEYKHQHLVERRISNMKGPLKTSPIFLKTRRRIESLLAVISIALLFFSLIERQVRITLKEMPNPISLVYKKPGAINPTGTRLFEIFEKLQLINIESDIGNNFVIANKTKEMEFICKALGLVSLSWENLIS